MRTVLIVGETLTLPELEATMLERSEFRVEVVPTNAAAEAVASRGADLVIVASRAKGEDMARAIAALRARGGATLPILIVSRPAERDALAAAGGNGFVSPPLTTARLLDAVRRHAPVAERRETRVPFAAKVDFERAEGSGTGYAHDLTGGGMFLVTREPFVEGEEIEIGFTVPHPEAHAVRSRARVVRAGNAATQAHRAAGFGLAFVSLAGEHRIEIARWMRHKGSA